MKIENFQSNLFKSFPNLDQSLILSILSDYPNSPGQNDLKVLHQTLQSLSLEAQNHSQSSDFQETDGSGSTGFSAGKEESNGSEEADVVGEYWDKEDERAREIRGESREEWEKGKVDWEIKENGGLSLSLRQRIAFVFCLV
jgi:hypothetical protein